MTRVYVPPGTFPGLKIISNLSEDQIDKICQYLDRLDADPRINKFGEFLEGIIKLSEVGPFLKTIMSFSELIRPSNVDYEKLATDLAESYNFSANANLSNPKIKKLAKNILEIFNHSINLKIAIKASELLSKEDKLFRDVRIITDIRLIFNEDLTEENSDIRNALIIHHLHLTYRKNDESYEEISIAVDCDDLKRIKKDIERAINKNEIITNDYQSSFKLLNFNEHA